MSSGHAQLRASRVPSGREVMTPREVPALDGKSEFILLIAEPANEGT
jgi:hypothetical protein